MKIASASPFALRRICSASASAASSFPFLYFGLDDYVSPKDAFSWRTLLLQRRAERRRLFKGFSFATFRRRWLYAASASFHGGRRWTWHRYLGFVFTFMAMELASETLIRFSIGRWFHLWNCLFFSATDFLASLIAFAAASYLKLQCNDSSEMSITLTLIR